ncbi:DEAD/DEAH box helicase [Oceanobacillus halotolerans]|uniref:DEAD/DEAH box helicase n=1 Tax=Oceanobacillus halotolerans TaxID=2663380 RepID=UPI0021F6654C|nr:DEAD/DEAH box helicase family protein [Oceanobacillus halotolerans]
MACESLYYWTGQEIAWPKYDDPLTWEGTFTAAQQHAADRIVQAINQKEELLVWAVCGAGKTEMLFPGIREALKLGRRICIATPRADVVRELKPRIQQAFADVYVQALYGGSDEKDGTAQIILATTHQLLRYRQAFDLVIIDEIDAFPFHHDPSLPFAANRAKKDIHTTIYLTATPRSQQRLQIARKKLPHVFVPIRYHGHPLPVPTYKMCFTLQKDLKSDSIPRPFRKWMKTRKKPNRQLLIFVPTIALAEKMKETLTQQGILGKEAAIESVHAEDQLREEKVQQFRNKTVDALVTTTILERGVTFPSVDVAILDAGNDVFDEAALVQIAGRAGRSSDDPTGEVVFFHDGKTEAMVQAVRSIQLMNKRGGF